MARVDVTTDVVECNKARFFSDDDAKEIMKLNASLKQEMIDFLDIYDVLQYGFSQASPVECGSFTTELPTTTGIPSARRCR